MMPRCPSGPSGRAQAAADRLHLRQRHRLHPCLRFRQIHQWPNTTDVVTGRRLPIIGFTHKPPIAKLTALGPAETLWAHLKVAFMGGVLLALPIVLPLAMIIAARRVKPAGG